MVKKKFNNAYIQSRKSRFSSFTKRKSGLFSKARELSAVTNASVLIICQSESQNFYWQTSGPRQPQLEHISSVVIESNRQPSSIIHGEKRGDERTPGNLTNPLSVRQKRRLNKLLREMDAQARESEQSASSSRSPTSQLSHEQSSSREWRSSTKQSPPEDLESIPSYATSAEETGRSFEHGLAGGFAFYGSSRDTFPLSNFGQGADVTIGDDQSDLYLSKEGTFGEQWPEQTNLSSFSGNDPTVRSRSTQSFNSYKAEMLQNLPKFPGRLSTINTHSKFSPLSREMFPTSAETPPSSLIPSLEDSLTNERYMVQAFLGHPPQNRQNVGQRTGSHDPTMFPRDFGYEVLINRSNLSSNALLPRHLSAPGTQLLHGQTTVSHSSGTTGFSGSSVPQEASYYMDPSNLEALISVPEDLSVLFVSEPPESPKENTSKKR